MCDPFCGAVHVCHHSLVMKLRKKIFTAQSPSEEGQNYCLCALHSDRLLAGKLWREQKGVRQSGVLGMNNKPVAFLVSSGVFTHGQPPFPRAVGAMHLRAANLIIVKQGEDSGRNSGHKIAD